MEASLLLQQPQICVLHLLMGLKAWCPPIQLSFRLQKPPQCLLVTTDQGENHCKSRNVLSPWLFHACGATRMMPSHVESRSLSISCATSTFSSMYLLQRGPFQNHFFWKLRFMVHRCVCVYLGGASSYLRIFSKTYCIEVFPNIICMVRRSTNVFPGNFKCIDPVP